MNKYFFGAGVTTVCSNNRVSASNLGSEATIYRKSQHNQKLHLTIISKRKPKHGRDKHDKTCSIQQMVGKIMWNHLH
eukprot:5516802-Amphidinium_carterae.1